MASVAKLPGTHVGAHLVRSIITEQSKKNLLKEEVWWQENVGVNRFGLNKRKDLATVSRKRKK